VPNTTHVTQVTDRNYGYFKSLYRKNLKNLVEFCDSKELKVQQSDIPLLVFGKRYGWDEDVVLEHAFDEAFSIDKSKDAWSKIGISPFTHKCLEDSKVSHELYCFLMVPLILRQIQLL